MKNKLYLILSFLLFFAFTAMSQNFCLKVSICSGAIQYQKEGFTKWENCKQNTLLQENDFLKFSKSSYALFTTNDKKLLEYKTEGTIKVKSLLDKNKSNLTSSIKNVVQNIVEDVISKSNNNQVTSLSDRALNSYNIQTHVPKNKCYLFDTLISFSWYSGCKGYNFKIMDKIDKLIYESTINDTFIVIDPSDEKIFLAYDELYRWSVSCKSENKSSGSEMFLVLSKDASDKISDSTKFIISEIGNPDDNAFPNIVLASFYERNNLFLEVESCYQRALKIAPNQEFRNLFANFLVKIGDYNKAKEVLNKIY